MSIQEYYKNNNEIASVFGVVEGTVRNWIKKSKKLNIQTVEINNKIKIIRSKHNEILLKEIVGEGKKYKPTDDKILVKIKKSEFSFMTDNQIISMIDDLKTKREISLKYSYLDEGAVHWDSFYSESINSSYNNLDIEMLYENYDLIKKHFSEYDKINIVDIGCGNSLPVIELLKKLKNENFLNSYSAVDISEKMLEISKKNLSSALKNVKLKFKLIDIELDSLQEYLYSLKKGDKEKYPTLILFLSGTIGNFQNKNYTGFNIKEGMFAEDKLLITNAFETKNIVKLLPEMAGFKNGCDFLSWLRIKLGFTDDIVEDSYYFDNESFTKFFGFKLKKDITLEFTEFGEILNFNKSEIINTWRFKKDDFNSIYQLAHDMDMEMRLVVRHPVHDNIMYMLSKPARIG